MDSNLTIWTPNEISFSEADGKRTVQGYFAVFYDPTNVGTTYRPDSKVEMRINPGALDQTLAAGNNVYALWSHDWKEPLGDTTSGTLKIGADSKGYSFSLTLPRTTRGNDAWILAQDRIVRGMSFTAARHPGGDKWSKSQDGRDILTFYRFGQLTEVTITPNPAFKGTNLFAAEAHDFSDRQMRKEIVAQMLGEK
jgi:HK97 family phage prohead protease